MTHATLKQALSDYVETHTVFTSWRQQAVVDTILHELDLLILQHTLYSNATDTAPGVPYNQRSAGP